MQPIINPTVIAPEMPPLRIHFRGPLTFAPGERSLFHSAFRDSPCVYLWTVASELDGRHYIHYVGEAQAFAPRHREHLIHILGLDYGIFDPAAARRGVAHRVWNGMWRDKGPDAPARALAHHVQGAAAAVEYVTALSVFVGPVAGDRALRRQIEGSIGLRLRTAHPDANALYPDDNRVGVSAQRFGRRVELIADAQIAGLDPTIEI